MRATQEAQTAPPLAVSPDADQHPTSRRHRQKLWLLFWIIVPLVVGLTLGWAQAGSAKLLPRGTALLFVLSGVMPSWWLYGLVGMALRHLAPRLPRALLLLLAPILAAFLMRPLYVSRYKLFGLSDIAHQYPGLDQPLALALSYLFGNILGIVLFPLIALFFHAMFRLDVLQWIGNITSASQTANTQPNTQPSMLTSMLTGLLTRLPPRLGTNIHVLIAAEHYLRVITDRGEAMVLYRLGDAIRDMAAAGIPGIQVHRSYWIAHAAIVGHVRDGSRLALKTPAGIAVPVSRSYRQGLTRLIHRTGFIGVANVA